MRSTLPQSTPVRDRAGTGVNGNDLRKYSRCSMEMKFVTNAETLTTRCSDAAFSTFIIWRFKSPWIPIAACPRMLWSAAGMTRGLVSALDTKPDCVVAVLLSMNPLKLPLATLSLLKNGVGGGFFAACFCGTRKYNRHEIPPSSRNTNAATSVILVA